MIPHTLLVAGPLLMAALLFFTNLGGAPLRVNAEERCAEVVEAMVASGDYVLPRLDGEMRLNKPPLFYWAASAAAAATGGYSLTALRLPSAVAAMGLVVIMLLWSGLLNAPRESLLAAACLPVTYLFVQQARFGSFEMMLALFSHASVFAVASLVTRPRWRTAVAAAGFFSLALMTKGTPVFAAALLPVVVWIVGMGRKRWLTDLRVLAVFAASFLAGFGWYLYLLIARPEARQMILAIFLLPFGVDTIPNAGAEHYEGPHFYLVKIWDEAFPISLLLPVVAIHVWQNRFFPADSVWRLVLLCFLVPFAVFSLIPQKQDHYLLPMIMPLALLCARSAVWGVAELRDRSRLLLRVPGWLLAALLVVCGAVGALGFPLIADWSPAQGIVLGLFITGAGLVTAVAVTRMKWQYGFASAVFGLSLVWIGYFAVLVPVIDSFGSGRIYFDPRYNPHPWEEKFRRHPILVNVLDVKRGLRHVDDVERELRSDNIHVTASPAPRLP